MVYIDYNLYWLQSVHSNYAPVNNLIWTWLYMTECIVNIIACVRVHCENDCIWQSALWTWLYVTECIVKMIVYDRVFIVKMQMRSCTYLSICMFVCISVGTHMCLHVVCLCVCVCVRVVCECDCVGAWVYMCVNMHSLFLNIYMCVCMYVCVCVCVCLCVRILFMYTGVWPPPPPLDPKNFC